MVGLTTREAAISERELETPASQPRVAYIMSRFPKLTETFILFEMLAMVEQGVTVELFPLLRHRTDIMHPEAERFMERAHFVPFISAPILRANLRYLRRKPRTYFSTLRDLLKGNWGSFRYFSGALGIFPKSVYFAAQVEHAEISHVHAHFASHPAAAAFIIHRLTGVPFSFTAHGSDIHRDRTMLSEKVAEASFVVPISDFNKEVIIEACDGRYADKMIVIHCGVDTDHFRPQNEDAATGARAPQADSAARPLTICCIGTLHEVKGQHYLIEACRLLKERNVAFRCHFIGDGPDRAALEEQCEQAGISEWVTFHGQQTRAEVAGILRVADVVAAPSVPSSDGRREGIPVALMEAMSTGLPVVASRLSGIPELVEDEVSGLLTPPGDAAALAGALERLWREPALRQRLGRAARQRIRDEFDLHRNARRLAQRFHTEVLS